MRHEVTAAHTRSLFCSLQLFFSPLALIVVMPTVHKSSRCVAAQQESLPLFPFPLLAESLQPNAPLAGTETRSGLMAAAHKPQPLTRALCAPLFGETHCPAAAAYKAAHGGLSPPPTHSVPRVHTANFACRFRSSPFTPPRDRPASPQHLENWSSPQRPYPELLAEILAPPSPLRVSTLGWTALFFPGSGGGSGFC